MESFSRHELINLYIAESKHSGYQVLPRDLARFFKGQDLPVKSRAEAERLEFVLKHVEIEGKDFIDIGGNTGFFSFESLRFGASKGHYFEGNEVHARFVACAVKLLGLQHRLEINQRYFSFGPGEKGFHADIMFLLNVLHHVGDDYGDRILSVERARVKVLEQLRSCARHCDVLAFQLGFNWRGDRNACLFEHGTKSELIDFVRQGTSGAFEVLNIGIPVIRESGISYEPVSEENIHRQNALGEFLNRPLFLMKSVL